jgi:hypothetical protein
LKAGVRLAPGVELAAELGHAILKIGSDGEPQVRTRGLPREVHFDTGRVARYSDAGVIDAAPIALTVLSPAF